MNRAVRVIAAACLVLAASGCTISAGLKKKPVPLDAAKAAAERTPIYRHDGWIIARGSIHNHTTYSDGCRSAEDLLEMARLQGMAILAYTDHREGSISGGKSGLVRASLGGVEDYGYDVYYERLRELQERAAQDDMIVLKGVEVIPWFYNYGRFPHLVLDGLQEHFTVYAVEDPAILANMPVRKSVPVKPEPIPDKGPWQRFVDYIVENGGIVHAVHVEDGGDMWYGPAHGACPPPINNLHEIKRLTGFAVLPSAWHEKTAGPGGLWDTTLLEYMAGMRPAAMWASADADYHCDGSLAIATTLFYMKEFTEAEVYRCMRQGRMVALQGEAFQDVYVAEWWVAGTGAPEGSIMHGMEIKLDAAPRIRFALDKEVPGTTTRLIRNGMVVHEQQGAEIEFTDVEMGKRREPAFYRVEVQGPRADRGPYQGPTMPESELFTNPVFVRFK